MPIEIGDSTATVRSKINAVLTDAGLDPADNVDTTAATNLLNEAAATWSVPVTFYDRQPEAEFRERFATLETGVGVQTLGIVADGDSMTNGPFYIRGALPPYPDRLSRITGRSALNLGVSGRTLAEMDSTYASRNVGANFNPESTNTLVIWGGTNDLGGSNLAALQGYLTSYVGKAVASGFKVVCCTIPARSSDFAVRDAFNVWLRANYRTIGASALADLAALAELQNPADKRYFADGLHLTAAGNGIVAQAVRAACGMAFTLPPQFVLNGNFGTNLDYWDFYSSTSSFVQGLDPSIATIVSGKMRLTVATNKIYPVAETTLSDLQIGATYSISASYSGTPPKILRILTRPGDHNNAILNSPSLPGSGTWTGSFVATQTSHLLWVNCNTDAVGQFAEWDDLSVVRAT